MPQSAYYSTYAEYPSLSYYDHPPMIGWLLWGWFWLLGKSAWTVRLATFTTTFASQVAFFALARTLFRDHPGDRIPDATRPGPPALAHPKRPARTALAVYATTAMATLLSFIAVPDVPLVLAWTLSLWALHRVTLGGRETTGGWLLAGAAMGLALLSKYTAVYLQGGLFLFLLASPRHRRQLRTPGPWLAVAVAHVVALPVYVWNARHGWASFVYQSAGRASEAEGADLDALLGFLASQALVFLPIPLFAFLWIAGRDLWRILRSPLRMDRLDGADVRLFLLSFSVPVFATCIALAPFTWVKSNWPMPAYVAATLLVALSVGRRAVRWHLATSALLHLLLTVWIVWYPVPVESDDTWVGWSELADAVEERVEALAPRHPDLFVFSADHYKTTAELRFYSDELQVYGMNILDWNALHYAYIGEDPDDLRGRDALFIRSETRLRPSSSTDRYIDRIRQYFGQVQELDPIIIRQDGRVVRWFRVFLCRGYAGIGN